MKDNERLRLSRNNHLLIKPVPKVLEEHEICQESQSENPCSSKTCDTALFLEDTLTSFGLLFRGEMTSEDYAKIFIESKPKWSTWTLEEKVAYREKLSRAINAGRVELASVEEDIKDEGKKLSKAERAALDSALDLSNEPTKKVARKTAEFKALESYAKALGLTIEDAAKALSRMKVPFKSVEELAPARQEAKPEEAKAEPDNLDWLK